MNAEKANELLDSEQDENDELTGSAALNEAGLDTQEDIPESKKSALSRLKGFFSKKAAAKKEQNPLQIEDSASTKLTKKVTADSIKKINDFLGSIENQLDKVDEQNKTLLDQLSELRNNNASLLAQVHTLTANNDKLTEQFNNMKKREKVAKTLAIISAILAISLSAYNILKLILKF